MTGYTLLVFTFIVWFLHLMAGASVTNESNGSSYGCIHCPLTSIVKEMNMAWYKFFCGIPYIKKNLVLSTFPSRACDMSEPIRPFGCSLDLYISIQQFPSLGSYKGYVHVILLQFLPYIGHT